MTRLTARRALVRVLAAAILAILAQPAVVGATPDGRISAAMAIKASGATVVDGSATRLLLDLSNGPTPKGKTALKFGHGAASMLLSTAGDGQTARGRAYYKDGPLKFRMTYTTAEPDAEGSSAITGSGMLRGDGKYFEGARGKFDVTGSQSADGLVRLRFEGTVRYFPLLGSGRGH
jgi:hypothetical protein